VSVALFHVPVAARCKPAITPGSWLRVIVRRSPIGARLMPVTASTTGGRAIVAAEEAFMMGVEDGLVGSRKDIFVFACSWTSV
jgi:hypothetical protein